MTSSSRASAHKRATILDVAAAAGVSRQTVTRAMNDMPGISQATRERVQKLAREIGYTPSRFAKGLVQGARTSIGLAIPDLTNPYFPAFASSVVEMATRRGWNVVVDDYGHGTGRAVDAVERLAPQVDAVIGYLDDDSGQAQALMGSRPVVLLDQPAGRAAGRITFDYSHAARLALQYLAADGRRHIAYLDSSQNSSLSARGNAVADAAKGLGIHLLPARTLASANEARPAVLELLEQSPEVDGLLAFNDLVAAGALKALAQANRSVPHDCAVIGMDGIPLGELVSPELTTLSLDLREVGRAAVELLEGLLSGTIDPGSPDAELVLRHELIVRESA
ncbi:LacI family DNA-binding transcriptional regulator [Pseudarthrobacter sp. J75]|uniref:LacI family DNA-binding transcriptional regulator n=1 Tax=unclassified Pseudarthrobacter TaxID=2647000 RepID=UPI002E805547|nr:MULTISPECIES: LacI family DNA-binding transcriptional regulator [unclassified Pseudarthrobacter]MEE2524711.1 LacI family DNA-binding transcriptional regulator [Pseudarthrobacter sp. J47]MEE2530747.1 LacI family DNA-binding transcriptional regulator [Pseudarthrobacter sp. J75]